MGPVGVVHSAATQAETCRAATTFATNLGLMRGHLLVAAELFEAGHIELAQRHSKHPAEEVYQELLPGLCSLECQALLRNWARLPMFWQQASKGVNYLATVTFS